MVRDELDTSNQIGSCNERFILGIQARNDRFNEIRSKAEIVKGKTMVSFLKTDADKGFIYRFW